MKNIKSISLMLTALACISANVALADIVVVVSAKSAVESLTASQVSQLFLGKIANFPSGGSAIPIDQSDSSVPYTEFYSKVTGKDSSQLKAYWSRQVFTGKGQPPKAVANSAEVKKLIAENPNLIGYIDKGAADSSVKSVFAP